MTRALQKFIRDNSKLIQDNKFEELFYIAYRQKLAKHTALELREALVTSKIISDEKIKNIVTKWMLEAFSTTLKNHYLQLRDYPSFFDLFYNTAQNQGLALNLEEMIKILQENRAKLKINVKVTDPMDDLDAAIFYYGDF